MSAKENSEVAVEKGTEEKAPADKCDLKGTKRASEDKTPEAKKYRKEENGGGEPDRVGEFAEDEEEIEDEDEEEDIGDGEEDELEGEDEELEEEEMAGEEEDEDA